VRAQRDERSVAGGIVWQPGWRTEIELAGTTTDLKYQDPDDTPYDQTIDERLDRVEDGLRADVSWRVRGRSSLLLHMEHDDIRFDDPYLLNGEPIARDTTGTEWLTGIELGPGPALTGRVLVGRANIDAESPTIPDLRTFVSRVELAYRLREMTRLEFTGAREPGFSVRAETAYYVSTLGGLRWIRFLNRMFGVEAGGEAGRLTFPESATAGIREDDILRWDVGMRLRLFGAQPSRRVEYRLRVGHYRRDSNEDTADQNKNTVVIDATFGY
jgi:hypothetical protein